MAGKSLKDEARGLLEEILNMDNPEVKEVVEVGLGVAEDICNAVEKFMSDPRFQTNTFIFKPEITDEPIIEPNPDLIQAPIQMVYLAGPVDNADEKDGHAWRDISSDVLYRFYGIATYHPQAPWRGFAKKGEQWWILHAKWLDLVNRAAITGADALLVNLRKPSLGTTREIEFAKSIGKPVFIFTGGSAAKNYLTYDLYEYCHMEEAIEAIYNYGR